jgi:hypothetical protein
VEVKRSFCFLHVIHKAQQMIVACALRVRGAETPEKALMQDHCPSLFFSSALLPFAFFRPGIVVLLC